MPKDTTWLRDVADILRGLDPPWIFATLVGIVVAYRLPQIITAISSARENHRRVSDEINRKQRKAALDIEEKQARLESRRGTRAEGE
jgi:hypothetical protein